jgi:hypothetical protein
VEPRGFSGRPSTSPSSALLDECFRVKGRENFYLATGEIQRDLDAFMAFYNLERSPQGHRLNERTLAQALRDALGLAELPNLRFKSTDDTPSVAAQPDAEEVETEPETAWTSIAPTVRGVGELLNLYTDNDAELRRHTQLPFVHRKGRVLSSVRDRLLRSRFLRRFP